MKKVLIALIVIIVGFISFGYIQKHNGLNGDKWIGIGILLVTFVLMPLFLYSRLCHEILKLKIKQIRLSV